MHKNATFQMRPNAIKCSMLRMHHVTNAPSEADYENALKCVIMHHIQNAAGRRMHQHASSAGMKNAAVENANKGSL